MSARFMVGISRNVAAGGTSLHDEHYRLYVLDCAGVSRVSKPYALFINTCCAGASFLR